MLSRSGMSSCFSAEVVDALLISGSGSWNIQKQFFFCGFCDRSHKKKLFLHISCQNLWNNCLQKLQIFFEFSPLSISNDCSSFAFNISECSFYRSKNRFEALKIKFIRISLTESIPKTLIIWIVLEMNVEVFSKVSYSLTYLLEYYFYYSSCNTQEIKCF